jgi:adenine phosphoribosyltransferase
MPLTDHIRDVPDFPKPGIMFKDITPLLANPAAFADSITQLADHYKGVKIDAIAAAEARGFLFAAPLALQMKLPLVPLRKPGKLPHKIVCAKYDLEYGSAELQMHEDAVIRGHRVLLLDDVLATGGTMRAGCSLIESVGGVVVGCAFVIELSFLQGRERLAGYDVFSLVTY